MKSGPTTRSIFWKPRRWPTQTIGIPSGALINARFQYLAEFEVCVSLHHSVHSRQAYVAMTPNGSDPLVGKCDCRLKINRGDIHAKNISVCLCEIGMKHGEPSVGATVKSGSQIRGSTKTERMRIEAHHRIAKNNVWIRMAISMKKPRFRM